MAAAFVVHLVALISGTHDRIVWEAQLLSSASSSFHAECTAMEMAVTFTQILNMRREHGHVTKKRRRLFIA